MTILVFKHLFTYKIMDNTSALSFFLLLYLSFPSSNSQLVKNDIFVRHDEKISVRHQYGSTMLNFNKTSNAFEKSTNIYCTACKIIVPLIRALLESKASEDRIAKEVIKLCIVLNVEDESVCNGIVNMFREEALFVLTGIVLSTDEICGSLFGNSCAKAFNPLKDWNVTLPDTPKPPSKQPEPPLPSAPRLRVLQISDIHLDLAYVAGSNTQCGEPLCCRNITEPVIGEPAGHWGDYRKCDLPPWTLVNLFEHLCKEHFDYILWTGDLPSHNDWNQPRSNQLKLLDYLHELFKKYFPNTPIYSTVGNHESSPVNSFPPSFITGNYSNDWLYNKLAEVWSDSLPKSAIDKIKEYGYYTTVIRPGFRLVAVNSNFCLNLNLWLYLNETDPTGELEWLIMVLQHAEDNKEKVHIISHVPPGINDCLKSWSWNYYRIVNRYESTIAAQFFGHTHTDSIQVFYDLESFELQEVEIRPTSVAYIAPSVTPYSFLNPGYRVYEVDGFYKNSSWAVLDHQTYFLNLTEANLSGIPKWKLEYSAKKDYGLKGLYPKDWHNMINGLAQDEKLMQSYYRNYYKQHPPEDYCDSKCQKKMICDMRTARSYDPLLCEKIRGRK